MLRNITLYKHKLMEPFIWDRRWIGPSNEPTFRFEFRPTAHSRWDEAPPIPMEREFFHARLHTQFDISYSPRPLDDSIGLFL